MKNIKVDFMRNTIIVSKSFYEQASNPENDEYVQLKHITEENPGMKVIVNSRNCHKSKCEYKGLTYDYMRRFIRVLDRDNLINFELAKGYYEDIYTDNAIVYHNMKEWFLNEYPRHKEMIVEKNPANKSNKNKQEAA